MRILLLIFMFLQALAVRAEDVIQVVPFKAQPGATSADGYSFSINMNNSSAEIWAFQFDILLPVGMTFDDTGGLDPFELGDRCPHTIGRGGVKNFKHTVSYKLQDDGWWRIAVITTDADRIDGNSGEVLRAYYLTDDDFESGIHPIQIRGAVLTITGNSDVKPDDSSSYCYVGNSPCTSSSYVDLSALEGYLPSWVVSSVADELTVNTTLTEFDITGATALGSELTLPNSNALCYVAESSECADSVSDLNVVLSGDAFRCDRLSINDGGYGFGSTRNVECSEASYDRMYKGGVWSTVCLPFAVSVEKVSELFASGVEIEELTSYDDARGMLYFSTVECMLPNRPYIIKCPTDMKPFEDVSIDGFGPSVMDDIICNGAEMRGLFSKRKLDSNTSVTYYVFDSVDGSFVLVGKNATVHPFRSFISIDNTPELNNAPTLSHNGDSGETSMHNVTFSVDDGDVYDINGVKIGNINDSPEIFSGLKSGIYMLNNKKIINCK